MNTIARTPPFHVRCTCTDADVDGYCAGTAPGKDCIALVERGELAPATRDFEAACRYKLDS